MTERAITKLNDRDLLRAFEKVREAFEREGSITSYESPFNGELDDSSIKLVESLAGFSIATATIKIQNMTWIVSRTTDHGLNARDKLNFRTQRYVEGGQNREGPKSFSTYLRADSALLQALSRPLASTSSASEYAAIESHAIILEKMESVAAHLIEESDRQRRRIESEFTEKELSRQKHFDTLASEERARSDEYRRQIEEEFAKKSTAIEERQRDLDALKKSLDDRNNTHVRREIRTTISSIISDRLQNFTVSKATKTQYLTVNVASIGGFVILAAATIYFGSQIQIDPQTKKYGTEAIALIIKSASFGAATIALGSWYLGWLNRWFQRIADSEFKLQQFRLDIERASWLAETVLEWKSSSQEPFPELLATRLSDGLFQSTGSSADGPRTPASHLAEALFGSASSAKIRVGENELNFDRSGIKRLDE